MILTSTMRHKRPPRNKLQFYLQLELNWIPSLYQNIVMSLDLVEKKYCRPWWSCFCDQKMRPSWWKLRVALAPYAEWRTETHPSGQIHLTGAQTLNGNGYRWLRWQVCLAKRPLSIFCTLLSNLSCVTSCTDLYSEERDDCWGSERWFCFVLHTNGHLQSDIWPLDIHLVSSTPTKASKDKDQSVNFPVASSFPS